MMMMMNDCIDSNDNDSNGNISNNVASNKNDTDTNTTKAQHKIITLIAIKNLIFLNNLR